MRVPPAIGNDWKAWAQALSSALSRGWSQLDAVRSDSSAAVDGALVYDPSTGNPQIARGSAFVTLSTRVAAPSTAASTGRAGDFAYDSSYFYVCTAANTWKRVAIATW